MNKSVFASVVIQLTLYLSLPRTQVIEDLLERYQALLVRAEEEADGECGWF